MTFSPFGWIRAQAKAAFLAGIADGVLAIVPDGESLPTLSDLAARLAIAAPAAQCENEQDTPARQRKPK